MTDARHGALRVGNAGPEQMPDVRRDSVDLASLTVDGERERLAIWKPEVAIEAHLQFCRIALEALGQSRVVPEIARQTRGTELGIVDVTLDLAGRSRQFRQRAIGEEDRVPGILPALVF